MTAVTVICPNNRRVTVKLEAGKTMFQILDEACKKQGLVSENYGLKHHKRFIDLSLPFRLTGLPHNCTLEMEERIQQAKEEVEVAVQMLDGSRVTKKIPVDATLLDLLLDCEKESGLKLMEPEGENMYPVCHYLNNEYIGTLALAATTLKSIGIRGRALFRYTIRRLSDEEIAKINDSVEQAHVKLRKLDETYEKKKQENELLEQQKQQEAALICQLAAAAENASSAPVSSCSTAIPMMDITPSSTVSPSFNSADRQRDAQNDLNSSATPASNYVVRQARLDSLQQRLRAVDHSIENNTNIGWDFDNMYTVIQDPVEFDNFKFPAATKGVDLRSAKTANSESASIEACDRRTVAYRIDDKFDIGLIEPPEEFFEVTVNDVQNRQRRLQEESADSRPLFSESVIRERDLQNKYKAWKYSVIRIFFNDGFILQGTFRSIEKISALYGFVKDNLSNQNMPFQLSLPPNVMISHLDKNFVESGLAPRANVIFRLRQSSDQQPNGNFIKPDLVASAKSQAEAELTAHECLILNEPYVPYRGPIIESPPSKQARGAVDYNTSRPEASSSQPSSGGSSTAPKSSNLPKWFKGP